MEIHTKTYQTPNGPVEGVQTKWAAFNILLVTGPKGFLACPAIDVDACRRYGVAAGLVESTPDNPIGTALGITEGMDVTEAFALIA
jgi:uncharacterized protein YunC (DUF1805 family)